MYGDVRRCHTRRRANATIYHATRHPTEFRKCPFEPARAPGGEPSDAGGSSDDGGGGTRGGRRRASRERSARAATAASRRTTAGRPWAAGGRRGAKPADDRRAPPGGGRQAGRRPHPSAADAHRRFANPDMTRPQREQRPQPPGTVRGGPSGRGGGPRGAPPPNHRSPSPVPQQAPRSGPSHLPCQQQQRRQQLRQVNSGGLPQQHQRQQQHPRQYDHLWKSPQEPLQQHGDAHSPGGDGRKETYASHTESETSPESEATADPPSRGEDHPPARPHNPMAEPSAYTDRGRCVRHPHIKLRKKKLMGGWKIMLVNCPDCCIEEMLRMRREAGGAAGGAARASGMEGGGTEMID